MSNQTYDGLMFVALGLLPTLGTAYFAIDGIVGLPATNTVLGAFLMVTAGLGLYLQLASRRYRTKRVATGQLNVRNRGDKKTFELELFGQPEELIGKDTIVFKVAEAVSNPR